MFPSFQKMAQQMQGESGKLQGTALYTTMTFEGMKSAEEMKNAGGSQSSGNDTDKSSNTSGGIAGRLGGLMNRAKGGGSSSSSSYAAAEKHDFHVHGRTALDRTVRVSR